MKTIIELIYDYNNGLIKKIPLGSKCFEAGDAFSGTAEITVDEENQQVVSMFWNSLYFDNKEDADRKTDAAHAKYSDWQGQWILM